MYDLDKLPSQKGRIVIVTGANTGLGFETTKALVQKDAQVIMACRNLNKANAAKEKIEHEFKNSKVEVLQIDLSSLDSVREFAKQYNKRFDRLDILINNAGVMFPPYTKTENDFELQFGANYLGHFLLTGLLLDKLVETPDSRVVTLSSLAHKNGDIHFEDLQFEKEYDKMKAYAQSKLACLLFTFELQRRLEKAGYQGTISTAAHPGISDTELSRNMSKFLYTILKFTIAQFIMQSAKEGAKPTILAAIGKAEGGDYFGPTGFKEMKGKPGKAKYTDKSKDEELASKLWEVSEKLVDFSYL